MKDNVYVSRVLCLLLGFALQSAPDTVFAQESVSISSDIWCPFICGDDQSITGGLLVDVADEVFKQANIALESPLMPLNRAMMLVAKGQVDGIYAPAITDQLIMSETIVASRACFYTHINDDWRFEGIESLPAVTVSIIDSYGYDDGEFDEYVAKNSSNQSKQLDVRVGETAGLTNVQMLLAERIDVLIEHESVMAHLMDEVGGNARNHIRNAGCLNTALPLNIGFGVTNPYSAKWVDIVNQGISQLKASGRLDEIKSRYGLGSASK
ncbi:substrate-binding periplasmic protein [Litoribrevibacter albus]|uniref:Solute-binding protein family 3/N-terminal domain-containing protein n=1 Tax=Litoribrevibacter albus TaxID=1473156 RepID=A0AA37W535_9GAMM|nr:transporter substrate-binding domain-containing protein [Litoribrevibacter albus]GLQ30717.1 hypothetical protein GCM10007876_11960 [Litoribrevibacter albus]